MSPASSKAPSRGDVIMVDLDPTLGREQAGYRPAAVVSADRLNRSPAGLVMIAPFTSTDRGVPAHVRVAPPEGGLDRSSVLMVDQLRTISTERIGRWLGSLSPSTMDRVDERLRALLGLG